ncbi:MAG: hypothetical protein JSS28_13440 [Proteobacteria bacterium]|nr:hypothetical protein [Pseudomonadota bacterium]
MNAKTAISMAILALSSATGTTSVAAGPIQDSSLLFLWPASRLVGTYQSMAQVRVCGSPGPDSMAINTITFNAGGTVIAHPRFPPSGVPDAYGPGIGSRTMDQGTWSYDWRTKLFSATLRFDFFGDGTYRGTGVVERDMQLSADGKTASGPVHVTNFAPDGSVMVELCGTAVSTRL